MPQTIAYGVFDREFDFDSHEWSSSLSHTHTRSPQLGLLFKESLEFDLAIQHLRIAAKQQPNDLIALTNLAAALSRNDAVPEAVELTRRAIRLRESPYGVTLQLDPDPLSLMFTVTHCQLLNF